MDGSKFAIAAWLFSITFILNVPFGFFRKRTNKLLLKVLYIHLPIPAVIIGRMSLHLDYKYIPVLVLAAILGQMFGGRMVSFK